MILPLLLLACGGSDEPMDGPSLERTTDEPTDLPDSERATDEPEGRAFSGQTTAASTTEGGESSPTPRATAGPLMAQTSPETDREALVTVYNATGGPNWKSNNNWLSDMPISEWLGVTTDDNGRVTEMHLSYNHQLRGEIPPELGKLANLKSLDFSGIQLSGCLPSSLLDRLDMGNSALVDLRFCP